VRLHRGTIEIALADAFACTIASREQDAIQQAVAAHLGDEMLPLSFVVADNDSQETRHEADPFETLKQLRQEHPVVRALFDRFGAEIVWT
jgi:hypothetical protein